MLGMMRILQPCCLVMTTILLFCTYGIFTSQASYAENTPQADIVTNRPDPYQWMERDQNRFNRWLNEQSIRTDKIIQSLPLQQNLQSFLEKVSEASPPVAELIFKSQQALYIKTTSSHPYGRLFYKTPGHKARVLIDPPRGQGISFYSMSPNSTLLAYGLHKNGSELTTLHIKNLKNGYDLTDVIKNIRFPRIIWTRNEEAFFYSRLMPENQRKRQSEELLGRQVYYHRIGTKTIDDPVIFGTQSTNIPEANPRHNPAIAVDKNSTWVIGYLGYDISGESLSIYAVKSRDINGPNTPWGKIFDVKDNIKNFFIRNNTIYYFQENIKSGLTLKSKNLDLMSNTPDKTLFSWSSGELIRYKNSQNQLYFSFSENGKFKFININLDNTSEVHTIPQNNSEVVAYIYTSNQKDEIFFQTDSWTQSSRLFKYNPKTFKVTDTKLLKPSRFETNEICSNEQFATARDGSLIPVTLIYKRGLKMDGSHPAWLTGYGAYGVSQLPYFDATRLFWLNRGGVIAIAHVRGGGELGPQWHEKGKKKLKINSVNDFVDVAQFLIDQEYTRPDKLTAVGASAGGIIVGGAIAQRPDLFAAAAIDVGILNTLRLEQIPIGPSNIEEFGSLSNKDGYQDLLAIDAYAQLENGIHYPAVLLSVGLNDNRVTPWQSAKFAARLMEINQQLTNAKQVLFRVDQTSGHFSDTKQAYNSKMRDITSFLLWQTK